MAGTNAVYWIWLQKVLGCASHRVNKIREDFISARAVYEMPLEDRITSRRFTGQELEKMRLITLSEAEEVIKQCQKIPCDIIPLRIAFTQSDSYIYMPCRRCSM